MASQKRLFFVDRPYLPKKDRSQYEENGHESDNQIDDESGKKSEHQCDDYWESCTKKEKIKINYINRLMFSAVSYVMKYAVIFQENIWNANLLSY